MTRRRALLLAAAFALAIAACERVVVLTPGFDGGFDGSSIDGALLDGETLDTGGPGLDGGALPDANVPDAT